MPYLKSGLIDLRVSYLINLYVLLEVNMMGYLVLKAFIKEVEKKDISSLGDLECYD